MEILDIIWFGSYVNMFTEILEAALTRQSTMYVVKVPPRTLDSPCPVLANLAAASTLMICGDLV